MSTWTNSASPRARNSSGGVADQTGLGPVSSFSVPLGTRKVSYLHSGLTTNITWPGARVGTQVIITHHGGYSTPTVNVADRRIAGRVLSAGVVQVVHSAINGATPTPTDVTLDQ